MKFELVGQVCVCVCDSFRSPKVYRWHRPTELFLILLLTFLLRKRYEVAMPLNAGLISSTVLIRLLSSAAGSAEEQWVP